MIRTLAMMAVWLCLWAPVPLAAQEAAPSGGTLQRWLEQALSTADAQVRLTGFNGAWSRRATVESLTVSDASGVWLTLEGLVLDWDRAALLRGRIEVNELSAQRLHVARLPVGEPAPTGFALPRIPSPVARGFQLPDLPVAIRIGALRVAQLQLADPVLGAGLGARIAGTLSLAQGQAAVALSIVRTDEVTGEISVSAQFANATRDMSLDVTAFEDAGGLLATVLALPERPELELRATGRGDAQQLDLDLTLRSDGVERLAGQIVARPGADAGTEFRADLQGDLRPVFPQDSHRFLGDRQALRVEGSQSPDGTLSLTTAEMQTGTLRAQGQAVLDSSGWPRFLMLDADVSGLAGVALPSDSGFDRATLRLRHDMTMGPDWTMEALLVGLQADGLTVQEMALSGAGQLQRDSGFTVTRADGDVRFDLAGLAFDDAALQAAVGRTVEGSMTLAYQPGEPLDLQRLVLRLQDALATGAVSIGSDLKWVVALDLPRMDRFGPLAGAELSGRAALETYGTWTPATGALTATAKGTTQSLALGDPRVDPLLDGPAAFHVALGRDDAGTRVDGLRVETPHLRVDGSADLTPRQSTARFDMTLAGTAQGPWQAVGPVTARVAADQDADRWQVTLTGQGPVIGEVATDATLFLAQGNLARLTAEGRVQLRNLSRLEPLLPVSLAGALEAQFAATADLATQTVTVAGDWRTRDLAVGVSAIDPLLQGDGTGVVDISVRGPTNITIREFDARFDQWTATAQGQLGAGDRALTLSAGLADIGALAKDMSGPLRIEARVAQPDNRLRLQADATGAGGLQTRISGTMAEDLSSVDARVTGRAPLAILNGFTSPNLLAGMADLNLSLNGPLALQSLSGQIDLSGIGITLPAAPGNLEGGRATIALNREVAGVRGQLDWSQGGEILVAGQARLQGAFAHQFDIQLRNLVAGLPGQISARADGALTLAGDTGQGSRLAGQIDVAEVEVNLSETPSTAAGALIDVTHIGDSGPVRDTRRKAGLEQRNTTGVSSAPVPLDILVSMPGRVFLRGRGLDAELGGEIRVSGTAAQPALSGGMSLQRGRMDLLGQRLTLTRATVGFAGDLDPDIDIAADFSTEDTAITVGLSGRISSPELRLASVPEFHEDEILARLLFGRPISRISPVQAVQMAAAVRTLTGGGGTGFVERLRQRVGVDDLDVMTRDDGTVDVTVGAYLNENVYSDVEIGSDGSSTINLNLDLGNGLTARGSNSSDGRAGVGVFFERDY